MSDNGPIRLPVSAFLRGGGVLKIKRGGPGKQGSSGSLQRRYHAPIRAARDFHKPSKRHNGEFRIHPKSPDSPPIWNPLDPFIVGYQQRRTA